MSKDQGQDRRAQAAAVKAEADAAAKRDSRIKVIGGIAVAVVVVGIVLAGYLGAKASKPHADANAAQPQGTLSDVYGYPLQPIDDSKSTLVVFEDPQCPICGAFEKQFGDTVRQLASDKVVNVVFQMATFLDRNFPQSNRASRRAINGFGCAIDQGAGNAYHKAIYDNQPATEGVGYSDALLKKIGADAGLTGAKYDSFVKCYDAGTYLGWADNQDQYFTQHGVTGTPTLQLDGKNISNSLLTSPKALTDYINANKK